MGFGAFKAELIMAPGFLDTEGWGTHGFDRASGVVACPNNELTPARTKTRGKPNLADFL